MILYVMTQQDMRIPLFKIHKLKHYSCLSMAVILAAVLALPSGAEDADGSATAAVELGERIFNDDRFSHPDGDLRTSCASCHKTADPAGARSFTEQLAHSWHPWRNPDPGRDTLRNTPALLDVAEMPLLHMDGEFSSLQEQAHETLVGRNLGWLPDERPRALARIKDIIFDANDDENYHNAVKRVYAIDLESVADEERVAWLAKALTAFMHTMKSKRDSPYDDFLRLNKLDPDPLGNESSSDYADRLIAELEVRMANDTLQTTPEFPDVALAGARIFLRTEGETQVGNCVACHTPPLFTDFAFHNTGVTQEDYDTVHGQHAFATLDIPSYDEVERPAKQWSTIVHRRKPGFADLGRWNMAEPDNRHFRVPGESDADYMTRAIAAFKTPTLRQLGHTDPFMHNGGYATVEQALAQKLRASEFARADALRNGDPEMARIRLTEQDIPLLAAFLKSLTTVGARNKYPSYLQPKGDSYTGPRYGVQYPEEVTPNVRRRYNDPE